MHSVYPTHRRKQSKLQLSGSAKRLYNTSSGRVLTCAECFPLKSYDVINI